MPAKPIPGLGLVLGIVIGYLDVFGASYAAYRLAATRRKTFDSVLGHGLQWFAMLLAIALVTGLLMAIRTIGAGVMVGAGALMGLVGLVVQVLPLHQSAHFVRLFQVPGSRFLPYLLLDGSVLFMGVVFLVAGSGRWVADAKIAKLTGRDQSQGYVGQQASLPGSQPQQWGGYPGQPQQPPYPGQQPPHPGQQQPGGYPGQQQPPR